MKQLLSAALLVISLPALAQNTGLGTTTPTDQLHTTGTVRFEGYRGATTRLMQIDSSGRVIVTAAGAVSTNAVAQAIPDNGCSTATGVTSTISISGMPASVPTASIAARVNITHTFDGDLRIYLVTPGGATLTLANSNGGNGHDFNNTIFTDAAFTGIGAGAPPFAGKYKPIGGTAAQCSVTPTVSTFGAIGGGSINPNGTWTLKVYDAAIQDLGTLNSWSISFSGPESAITAYQSNYIARLNAGGGLDASNIYQDATGRIGIGTATPQNPLDVAGDIHTSGNIFATDGTYGGTVNATTVTGTTGGFGSLTVSGGSPAPGKLLTATNNLGNTAWTSLPPANTAFRAGITASQSYSPYTYPSVISFNTVSSPNYDDGNFFSTTTFKYTIPVTGVYQFTANIGLQTATPNGDGKLTIYISSFSSGSMGVDYNTKGGDPIPTSLQATVLQKYTAGEQIFVQLLNNSGSLLTVLPSFTRFCGVRIY